MPFSSYDPIELIIKILPIVPIVVIGGGILLIIRYPEKFYAFLKDLKKWWKNRNKEAKEDPEELGVLQEYSEVN